MTDARLPQHATRPACWIRRFASLIIVGVVGVTGVGALAQTDSEPAPAPKSTPDPPVIDHVAGDAKHLWIVRTVPPKAAPKSAPLGGKDPPPRPEPTIELLHRGPLDADGRIYRMRILASAPTHIAASGQTLWLLYEDRSVQSIVVDHPSKNGPRTIRVTQGAPLPTRGIVRFWTADGTGPVALVENPPLEDVAGDNESPEEPPAPDPTEPPAPDPDPPATEPDAAETTTEPDAEPSPRAPARLPEIYDRLLNPRDHFGRRSGSEPSTAPSAPLEVMRLGARGWEAIAAPESIDPQSVRDLLALDERRFALIAERSGEPAFDMHVYRADRWSTLTFGQRLSKPWDAVAIEGNAFIVMPSRLRPRFLIAPHLAPLAAPPSGDSSLEEQVLMNVRKETVQWWAVRGDRAFVIVAVDAEGALKWLTHEVADDRPMASQIQPLQVSDPPPPLPQPMTIVMVAAMMVGMLFLLGGGKRDPGAPVYVPRGTRPAGKVRIYAAIVDIAPAVGIAMIGFGIANPLEIVTEWVEHPDEWAPMAPGLTVIGIFTLHTTLTELFTGATLGKLLFKVRVVSMSGLPPNVWQVLARNAFKVIELMPPFLLLVVPFVNRFRQRLGDMVARTLVVAPQKDAQREDQLTDEDLWDDDLDNWDDSGSGR